MSTMDMAKEVGGFYRDVLELIPLRINPKVNCYRSWCNCQLDNKSMPMWYWSCIRKRSTWFEFLKNDDTILHKFIYQC